MRNSGGSYFEGQVTFQVALEPDTVSDVGCVGVSLPLSSTDSDSMPTSLLVDSGVSVVPVCRVFNFGTTSMSYGARLMIGNYYDETEQVTNHQPGELLIVEFPATTADWARDTVSVSCSLEVSDDSVFNNVNRFIALVLPMAPSAPVLMAPSESSQGQPLSEYAHLASRGARRAMMC